MALPSGLSEVVTDDEHLVRFVLSSNCYNSNGVKWTAYLPNPANDETSVFRSSATITDGLWETGTANAMARAHKLHGAACLQAESVIKAGLNIVPSEPPPAHANIVGWPIVGNDPAMQKASRMELAKLLARSAIFVTVP